MRDPGLTFAGALVVATGAFAAFIYTVSTNAGELQILGVGVAYVIAVFGALTAHAEMIRSEEGVLRR